jgi:esterase/lipase superfamily enzyme
MKRSSGFIVLIFMLAVAFSRSGWAAQAPPLPTAMLCTQNFGSANETRLDEESKNCLDKIAETMRNNPNQKLSIVSSVLGTGVAEAERLAFRAKDYLVSKKEIDANRIVLYWDLSDDAGLRTILTVEGASFNTSGLNPIDEAAIRPSPRNLPPQIAHKRAARKQLKAESLATVSIPPNHVRGIIERPMEILSVQFSEDATKHIVLQNVLPKSKDAFFAEMRNDIGQHRGEALVFIHGFNVSFDDATLRLAQLSIDLRFRGVPILYSWPSRGNTKWYDADIDTIPWTANHLVDFLKDVQERSGARVVHVLAHSMGNRALLSALQALSIEKYPIHFGQVVLAAPDVPTGLFKHDIPIVQTMAEHITLYASSRDKALATSHGINFYPRAGQSGPENLVIMPPVETIDATSIAHGFLGHSYYGDNTLVLDDMYYLINEGLPAYKRAQLFHPHLKQLTLGWYLLGLRRTMSTTSRLKIFVK